jgi:hypothetical protein
MDSLLVSQSKFRLCSSVSSVWIVQVQTQSFSNAIFSEKSKAKTLCSISGTSGACGPAGVNVNVDLTGGTGTAPAASGPSGTTNLTAAELVNTPITSKRSIKFEA